MTSLHAMEVLSSLGGTQSLASTDIANTVGVTAISSALKSFFQTQPYLASFLACSFKASAADVIAQSQEETEDDTSSNVSEFESTAMSEVDVSRNMGFLLYGGLYTGIFQNFLYTVLFPAWFGTEETWSTILRQVMADNFIFGPLLCLPLGYCFKTAFTAEDGLSLDSFRRGIEKYTDHVLERGLLTTYWSIWMPAQLMNFSVIPLHFRVLFVAAVSFFWFFVLSTISSTEEESTGRAESSS